MQQLEMDINDWRGEAAVHRFIIQRNHGKANKVLLLG